MLERGWLIGIHESGRASFARRFIGSLKILKPQYNNFLICGFPKMYWQPFLDIILIILSGM